MSMEIINNYSGYVSSYAGIGTKGSSTAETDSTTGTSLTSQTTEEFDDELLQITLLTAIAIFLVVAVAFRSVVIPAVLVLIVQCILMGAPLITESFSRIIIVKAAPCGNLTGRKRSPLPMRARVTLSSRPV